MIRPRVIPVLLLLNGGLVKTQKFTNPTYIGDPINAIKIFNDKEVDELILLDISSNKNKTVNFKIIRDVAGECFIPLCYGGGITKLDEIKEILNSGVEKISINTTAFKNPSLIDETAKVFGSQSIVVSIDVKKNWFGKYEAFIDKGKEKSKSSIQSIIKEMENRGAGEILINSTDKDGTFSGYDIDLIKTATSCTSLPVIACGGAGNIHDFVLAVKNGEASAVAAGAMFVFQGSLRGVLINYPSSVELKEQFYSKLG